MSIFYPDITLDMVTQIDCNLLHQLGVSGLILDIDNTLTTHNSPEISSEVKQWIDDMKAKKVPIILLSNNHEPRVSHFANMLGLPYYSSAMKPFPPFGLQKARKFLNLPTSKLAVVGDQIFTDVIGGNLIGSTTIMVTPLRTEGGPIFRFKRKIENWILKHSK